MSATVPAQDLPEVAAQLAAELLAAIDSRTCTVCHQHWGPETRWMCPCFSCFAGYADPAAERIVTV